MLEIKAFVRVNMVDKVVQALEGAGISNITVIDVRAIWTGGRETPKEMQYSIELAERYMNVAKLETLVQDEDGDRVIELIRAAARTGRPGDGMIDALPVTSAVHVRTGRRNEDALST
jgi:nitrogen regulatory protein P-II 1